MEPLPHPQRWDPEPFLRVLERKGKSVHACMCVCTCVCARVCGIVRKEERGLMQGGEGFTHVGGPCLAFTHSKSQSPLQMPAETWQDLAPVPSDLTSSHPPPHSLGSSFTGHFSFPGLENARQGLP